MKMAEFKEQRIRDFIDNYKRNSTRRDGRIDQCIEYMEYLLAENFRLFMENKVNENS